MLRDLLVGPGYGCARTRTSAECAPTAASTCSLRRSSSSAWRWSR